MSTAHARRTDMPPADPIKIIQKDILTFLGTHRDQAFSSYQVADGLRLTGKDYAIGDIQEAMGYLVDAGSVKAQEQRYCFVS